ncbi:MAG: DNA primase [Clostridia bacterium]
MKNDFKNNNVEEIKARINPLEIISKYVTLEKSGDKYKGLCPFHQENTPSFFVDPNNGLYYCFGCQAGGDVIKFLMELEGWTFIETMRYLAQEVGVSFNENTEKKYSEKEKLYKANENIKKYYKYNLYDKSGENGLAYLYNRGFTDKVIKLAEIGYALPGWSNLLKYIKDNDFNIEQYLNLGLIKHSSNSNYKQKYYDQFRNRIVFPIKDVLGRTIGFGGRTISDEQPKYLNSSESMIYHKSYSLYGIYQARKAIKENDYVILAEGYLDVLALWQAGFYNTVASLGTAFTKEQSSIIKRYTSNIVICYDGDSAGKSASKKAIEVMKNYDFNIKVAVIPNNLDPDDYIKEYGHKKFREEILTKAIPAMDFIAKDISDKYNLENRQEKLKFAAELVKFLSNLENRLQQAGYLDTYAEQYKLDKSALEYELRRAISSKRVSQNRNNQENNKKNNEKLKEKILTQEKKLLKLIIDSKKSIKSDIFVSPEHKKLCDLINSKDWTTIDDLVDLSREHNIEGVIANIIFYDSIEESEVDLVRQLTILSMERKINLLRKRISNSVRIGEDPTELLLEFKKLEHERAQLYTNK